MNIILEAALEQFALDIFQYELNYKILKGAAENWKK
jgi:hypothetical protein